jgi:hypothetical protein
MGRLAAIPSLCLWLSIIVVGRLIGFTITRTQEEPTPTNVDFAALLGGDSAATAPPQGPKP